jgi:hypothetical protein
MECSLEPIGEDEHGMGRIFLEVPISVSRSEVIGLFSGIDGIASLEAY